MRILINTPDLRLLGGVANHYLGLKKYWKENVKYNIIGKRKKFPFIIVLLPYDMIKFIIKVVLFDPDIVLLNPSLAKNALIRDFIYLRLCCLFRKKVAVFFHGFNTQLIPELNLERLKYNLDKCSCIFVLAQDFKKEIKKWNVNTPIFVVTTKVDDSLIENFELKRRNGKIKNILILSRITENKGVFIALKCFKLLQKQYPDLKLNIVGDGEALPTLKKSTIENGLQNVHISGSLSGEALKKEFVKADIYLFPTFHAEGMPTSVLEAMAFGLPVITRPVGGLLDFFENGKMGEMVNSLNEQEFARIISTLINDPEKVKSISSYNYHYATTNFLASLVAQNMESVLRNLVESYE